MVFRAPLVSTKASWAACKRRIFTHYKPMFCCVQSNFNERTWRNEISHDTLNTRRGKVVVANQGLKLIFCRNKRQICFVCHSCCYLSIKPEFHPENYHCLSKFISLEVKFFSPERKAGDSSYFHNKTNSNIWSPEGIENIQFSTTTSIINWNQWWKMCACIMHVNPGNVHSLLVLNDSKKVDYTNILNRMKTKTAIKFILVDNK